MSIGLGFEIWGGRLLLSAALGGLIGLERQVQGRAAGLRTHMMVSLGATLVVLCSVALASSGDLLSIGIRGDPMRVAAGVITGIGFLGAGAIIRTGDVVHGLTTAGCIWFTACNGVAVGLGMYGMAVGATALALVTLAALLAAEGRIPAAWYRDLVVTAGADDPAALEHDCRRALSGAGARVLDVEIQLTKDPPETRMLFRLTARASITPAALLGPVLALRSVRMAALRSRQEAV